MLITANHMNALANIFDARNLHAPQKTLTVGQQAFGIAYSADGKTVLVSNHGDGTISVNRSGKKPGGSNLRGRHGDRDTGVLLISKLTFRSGPGLIPTMRMRYLGLLFCSQ